MRKVVVLLIMILLALALVAGFQLLYGKILDGERLIAEGEKRIEEETANLVDGRARLEAGKEKVAEGRKRYKDAKGNPFLVWADRLFKGGKGFKGAREKIADGDERVARGEDKIDVGEKRLAAGAVELRRGKELVKFAKRARLACVLGAAFFASLSIILGFRWRRSLARTFMHTDA